MWMYGDSGKMPFEDQVLAYLEAHPDGTRTIEDAAEEPGIGAHVVLAVCDWLEARGDVKWEDSMISDDVLARAAALGLTATEHSGWCRLSRNGGLVARAGNWPEAFRLAAAQSPQTTHTEREAMTATIPTCPECHETDRVEYAGNAVEPDPADLDSFFCKRCVAWLSALPFAKTGPPAAGQVRVEVPRETSKRGRKKKETT